MFSFLYHLPDIKLFFLITLILTLMSVVCIYCFGIFYTPEQRRYNNVVIGSVNSLISIIYGVFVGLMALYLLNNITYTSDAVLHESNALSDIYRDSRWLADPAKTEIQVLIKNYINKVIDYEWPLMKEGVHLDRRGANILEKISQDLLTYPANNLSEGLLLHDMLGEIKTLYDSREQRIQMSYSTLNIEIWIVIFIGTILINILNCFYGVSFRLHALMSLAVALMLSAMIFLLITLDKPFQGEFIIEPNELKVLLELINEQQTSKRPSPKV